MFSGTIAQAQITRGQQSQDTLYALAKDTGGRAMFDSNDLSRGIRQAAQAVTGYYLVGYYSKNTTADGKFRRVKVSLAAEMSADLSYRAGYYGDKEYRKFTRADKERQLAEALRLEDPITEIPMAMEVNYFQISSAEYFVPISVRMPRNELTRSTAGGASSVEIDMIGEIKDNFGVTMRNMRDKIEVPPGPAAGAPSASPLIQYETGFTVLPGEYVIKLLARNSTTGRIGTFQASFTIPNLEREATRLPISSVVLSSQRVAPGEILKEVKQKIPSDKANPLVYDGQKLIPSVTRSFSAIAPAVRVSPGLRARCDDDAPVGGVRDVLSCRREGARDGRARAHGRLGSEVESRADSVHDSADATRGRHVRLPGDRARSHRRPCSVLARADRGRSLAQLPSYRRPAGRRIATTWLSVREPVSGRTR